MVYLLIQVLWPPEASGLKLRGSDGEVTGRWRFSARCQTSTRDHRVPPLFGYEDHEGGGMLRGRPAFQAGFAQSDPMSSLRSPFLW